MKLVRNVALAGIVAVILTSRCWGLPLTAGNIIVSNSPFVGTQSFFEFTPAGTLVQQAVMPNGGFGEGSRDLVLDKNGNVQFYRGTFSPELMTYDPDAGSFTITPNFPGWNTANLLNAGGMAAFGNYVFATDMTAASTPAGIVRFNVDDLSAVRFADGDNIDVNTGLDGLLYILPHSSESIYVFDPESLAFQRSFQIGAPADNYLAIAVDQGGDLFAVGSSQALGGGVFHFSSTGQFIDFLPDPGIGGFVDIDINREGDLLIASHGGVVMLTDTDFSSTTSFNTQTSNGTNFAAFVQPVVVPEPTAAALSLSACILLLFAAAARRRLSALWRRD